MNIPADLDASLIKGWLAEHERRPLMDALLNEMAWTQQSIQIQGNITPLPRLTAWHGTGKYRYSGVLNTPSPWTPALTGVRNRLDDETGSPFNSVLGNLYRGGRDSVGWHADDEPELGKTPTIASISLGATRKFSFKRRDGTEKVDLLLEDGDLLIMRGNTQRDWLHQVPKTAKPTEERINLTFRQVVT